jgi:hypothetical protein
LSAAAAVEDKALAEEDNFNAEVIKTQKLMQKK